MTVIDNNDVILEEDNNDNEPLVFDIPEDERRITFDNPSRAIKDLYSDYKAGELDVRPYFQRGYVWDKSKASRLIESILLGVPIPVIYTAEEDDGTQSVIDGQQRLISIFSFKDGYFQDKHEKFALSGLKVLTGLNRKSFKELDKITQRKVDSYLIPFIRIKKDSDINVRFEVFERLNTGAVKLNDQELRNCIYRGKYNDLLIELAENKEYQTLLKSPAMSIRMIDRELLLRFFAFYNNSYLKYKAPMRQFLNQEMHNNQNLNEEKAKELREVFKKSVDLTRSVFGDNAFRRFVVGEESDSNGKWENTKINKGLFDIVMWGFTMYQKNEIIPHLDSIREELLHLMTAVKKFEDSLKSSTDKPENVQYRFEKWLESLRKIVDYSKSQVRNYSHDEKKQLFDTDSTCKICSQKIRVLDDSEVDHIEFYWRGGETKLSNARLVHRYCNRQRGGRD